MEVDVFGKKAEFIKADIASLDAEAIVNPANSELVMGGGVAGAIKRKGGASIEKEAVRLAPVELGDAVITGAGSLEARYVIHVATMRMDFKTDYGIVRRCARSVFELCHEKGIREVAMPALGAGTGGLDTAMVAKIQAQEFFKAVRKGLGIERVIFVFYSDNDFKAGLSAKDYLAHLVGKTMQGPFLTVDAVVFDRLHNPERIVLIRRKNPPFGWALPGGFLDYGETVEYAAARELKEETGLDYEYQRLLGVYSDPNRDERFHTVTTAFYGIAEGTPKAADDAQDAKWFLVSELPNEMAFDHRKIIQDAMERAGK